MASRPLDHRDLGVTPQKAAALAEAMAAAGVRESDLRERFVLGRGKGGQKVNKTASACQLTHVPSGIVVTCSSERSRALNRFLARRRLVERIAPGGADTSGSRARAAKQKARRRRRSPSRVRPAMYVLTATYPDIEAAAAALGRLETAGRDLDRDVDLVDGAVAARGADAKVHLHHQSSRSTGAGAVGGLFCGLFLAALFPPAALAEAVLGTVGGALGGHFSGHADREEFRQLAAGLETGKAAVVALLDADTKLAQAREAVADAEAVATAPLDEAEAEHLRKAF